MEGWSAALPAGGECSPVLIRIHPSVGLCEPPAAGPGVGQTARQEPRRRRSAHAVGERWKGPRDPGGLLEGPGGAAGPPTCSCFGALSPHPTPISHLGGWMWGPRTPRPWIGIQGALALQSNLNANVSICGSGSEASGEGAPSSACMGAKGETEAHEGEEGGSCSHRILYLCRLWPSRPS